MRWALLILLLLALVVDAFEVGTYYPYWSASNEHKPFLVKDLETSKQTKELTVLYYAFANVIPSSGGSKFKCVLGDAFADYKRAFTAEESIDGVGDDEEETEDAQLRGNFNQLRKLKRLHPKLKLVLSIGGAGVFSKHFSRASQSSKLRKALVKSCIDLFLAGNLPKSKTVTGKVLGGTRAAYGLFDGLDVDWEFPGVRAGGRRDKRNHVLLLKEFRKQLDAFAGTSSRLLLTTAINGGAYFLDKTTPQEYVQYTDWINLMTYDFAGPWNALGPTAFQSNLYPAGADGTCARDQVLDLMENRGVPAHKIMLGVPFYAHGWSGVRQGESSEYPGLFQPAKRALEDVAYDQAKDLPGTLYHHTAAAQSYKYDGDRFWTYDTPGDVRVKAQYVRDRALGGIFAWSADQDDASAALTRSMASVNN